VLDHDSVGGVAEVWIEGLPAGLGDPAFAKLDALLAYACMSIGAVKGVEIGAGFAAARLRGSQNNDPLGVGGPLKNDAGGILGGISSGAPVVVRLAVKPTASIARPQRTVGTAGAAAEIVVKGRHDPCIAPRIVPVAEAMCALVVYDLWLTQQELVAGSVPAAEAWDWLAVENLLDPPR
jgi:chorismate synthase